VPHAEDLRKMNAGPGIKDALLVQRMWYWRTQAKRVYATNCPKWKARKNYLSLVRKHRALAERNGLRESDVYL
jgi:hypothetical protein